MLNGNVALLADAHPALNWNVFDSQGRVRDLELENGLLGRRHDRVRVRILNQNPLDAVLGIVRRQNVVKGDFNELGPVVRRRHNRNGGAVLDLEDGRAVKDALGGTPRHRCLKQGLKALDRQLPYGHNRVECPQARRPILRPLVRVLQQNVRMRPGDGADHGNLHVDIDIRMTEGLSQVKVLRLGEGRHLASHRGEPRLQGLDTSPVRLRVHVVQ